MAEIKRTYNENGEIETEYFEINGIKHGEYKEYYKDGQIKQISQYIDNKKQGLEKNYYVDGKLHYTCEYLNDKLHGMEKWYSCTTQKICYLRIFENGEVDAEVKHSCQLDMLVSQNLI